MSRPRHSRPRRQISRLKLRHRIQRRILQSLVPEEPLRRQLRDASSSASTSDPTSRAQKRPPVRTPKGKDQTSKSPRNLESLSDQTAPLVDNLSTASRQSTGVPPDEGTGPSPSVPTAAPSQVVGNASGLALRPKAKRRDKMPTSFDDSRATLSLKDQRSRTGTDSLPTPLPSVDESTRHEHQFATFHRTRRMARSGGDRA